MYPRRVLAVSLLAAAVVTSLLSGCGSSASHSTGPAVPELAAPLPAGWLNSVSAASATDAWAVGFTCGRGCTSSNSATERTLTVRWNGRTWSRVPSPSPGAAAELLSVSVTSHGTAYAAGWTCDVACVTGTGGYQPLLLRFDGVRWSRATTPDPGISTMLYSVSASGGSTVWAVGQTCTANCETSLAGWQSLVLSTRGNGWNVATQPITGVSPLAVAAGQGGAAWLVGLCTSWCRAALSSTLALYRQGTGDDWSPEVTPSPGDSAALNSVSAGIGGAAWAVGNYCTSACGSASAVDNPLIVHWDGTSWSVAASPGHLVNAVLSGVSSGSDGSAWAVGWTCKPRCTATAQDDRTLILSWTGTTWVQVASPTPAAVTSLRGVSLDPADPGSDAWAVGSYCATNCGTASAEAVRPVILHWTGTAWVMSMS